MPELERTIIFISLTYFRLLYQLLIGCAYTQESGTYGDGADGYDLGAATEWVHVYCVMCVSEPNGSYRTKAICTG